MYIIWLYSLISVLIISLISFISLLTFSIKFKNLNKILIYAISFSAGALFGDTFIHLLPEIIKNEFTIFTSLYILFAIVSSFFIEKVICWRHCHLPITKNHIHTFAYMNLFGDSIHNFIDGIIIGASYLLSLKIGIATTLAVILHEIPQEIGDFGVLLHGGFSKKKALFFNFITALTAVLGLILALLISKYIENLTKFLIPFAVGTFIYIAGSDLIPELHKEFKVKESISQLITFIFGILIMLLLLFIE